MARKDGVIDENLGGRNLDDAQQWTYSLVERVKSHFGINKVPPEIAVELERLQAEVRGFTRHAEQLLQQLQALGVSD